jgi:hypothetical protein
VPAATPAQANVRTLSNQEHRPVHCPNTPAGCRELAPEHRRGRIPACGRSRHSVVADARPWTWISWTRWTRWTAARLGVGPSDTATRAGSANSWLVVAGRSPGARPTPAVSMGWGQRRVIHPRQLLGKTSRYGSSGRVLGVIPCGDLGGLWRRLR